MPLNLIVSVCVWTHIVLLSVPCSCLSVCLFVCVQTVHVCLYVSLSYYRWSIYNCVAYVFDALECRFGLDHRACLTSTGTMNITPSAGSFTSHHPGKPRSSSTCGRIRAINPLKAASPDNSQSPTDRNSFTTLHMLLSSRYWTLKDS